jgi:hypothetical protein
MEASQQFPMAARIAECVLENEIEKSLECTAVSPEQADVIVDFVASIVGRPFTGLGRNLKDPEFWSELWRLEMDRHGTKAGYGAGWLGEYLAARVAPCGEFVWVELMSELSTPRFERMRLQDLSKHLDVLWLPIAEDLLVIDDEFRWLLFIDHHERLHLAFADTQ